MISAQSILTTNDPKKAKRRAIYYAYKHNLVNQVGVLEQQILNGDVMMYPLSVILMKERQEESEKAIQECQSDKPEILIENGLRFSYPGGLAPAYKNYCEVMKEMKQVPSFLKFIKTLGEETQSKIKILCMYE